MAAHPVLCTLLIGRLPALAPTDPLAVALDQVALTPLREILESGVASGGFTLDDAEVTAYALYGAISIQRCPVSPAAATSMPAGWK